MRLVDDAHILRSIEEAGEAADTANSFWIGDVNRAKDFAFDNFRSYQRRSVLAMRWTLALAGIILYRIAARKVTQ